MGDVLGPMDDPTHEPLVHSPQDASLGETTLPETQHLSQHADTVPKQMEKSKRLSKHTSMGPDTDLNLKRRTSKLGLFGLFNRSKINLGIETPQEKLDTQWEGIVSTERPVTRDPGAAYIPAVDDMMPIPESPGMPLDTTLRHQASKGKLRNRQSFKRESKRQSREPMPLPPSTWNAPPLFQVYPQSLKYSTLKAPLMSAEAILRLSKERNAANEGSAACGERSGSVGEKPQKEKKLKKSLALDNMAKGEWVDKTYVLVTAGYLLQYAGQGTYDRVPEKILQLTEMSAAFATDAIPGKPFVLQISQALNEDGTVETEMSRSMFKKMGGLRADMRRAVSNLLLVLDSPEEMNEWLVAVRKEIEALGGKEYNPEMPWDEPEDKPTEVKEPQLMPSQRYLVKRNPNQFSPNSTWESPHDVSLGDKVFQEEKQQEIVKSPAPSAGNRQSMTTSNSTNSRYVSDTHTSIDQRQLDRLRESYASTAGRTTSTSRDSSPNRSPLFDQDFIAEVRAKPLAKTSTYLDSGRLPRQTLQEPIDTDRESLQPTPTPTSRPNSTGVSSNSGPRSERTMSPERTISPAPNFSVPTFSKRYSTASTSPAPSTNVQSPPPITIFGGSSPSEDDETQLMAQERDSTVGELQAAYKSSPRHSVRLSSSQPATSFLNTPPTSSHSHITPPGSSDGERPYSRRFSSLDYARGISPVKPLHHSQPPHPPPNLPLPPVPDSTNVSKRTSIIPPSTAPPTAPLPPLPVSRPSSQPSPPPAPPPTCPLPPVPTQHRASSRASISSGRESSVTPSRSGNPSPASSMSPFPPPTTALPPVPAGRRPTTPNEKQHCAEKFPTKRDTSRTRLQKPRRTSAQADDMFLTTPPLPHTAFISTFTIEHQAAIQPSDPIFSRVASSTPPPSSDSNSSPPKPTRAAPPPPPPPAISPPPPATEVPVLNSPTPSTLPTKPPTSPAVQLQETVRESPPVYSSRIYSKTKLPTQSSPSVEATPRSTMAVEPPKPPQPPPAATKISIASPAAHARQQAPEPQRAAPHPFIPPIKLSHSRERGSFDGPWNAGYDQPKRMFADFSTA